MFTLIDIIESLIAKKKLIIINFLAVSVCAVVISLLMPKWYNARTTLMPPSDTGAFSMASLLTSLPVSGIALPGMTNPASNYIAILKSRLLNERIIDEFELMSDFKVKKKDVALKLIGKRKRLRVTDEGIIELRFIDKDAKKATDIANRYVELLISTYVSMNVAQAKQSRIFIEGQLDKCVKQLETAENELNRFQNRNKTISLPEQTVAVIEAVAKLQAELTATTVEIGVLSMNMEQDNPTIRRLASKQALIRKELHALEQGRANAFYISLQDVPDLGLEFARLTRDVKVQEAIFQLLTQQHEHAKLQEAKDVPAIQVLDKAVVPDKKWRPRRALVCIGITLLYMLILTASISLMSYWDWLKDADPVKYARYSRLLSSLRRL